MDLIELIQNRRIALTPEYDAQAGRPEGGAMNVTAEIVRELRERTGEGLMACKAALVTHDGNLKWAEEHLRCEGQAVVRRGPNARQPCGCPVRR